AAAQRVLGQAFSIASAPAGGLPVGVAYTSPQTITNRGIELAEAGQRMQFGESLEQTVLELLFDWSGSRSQDAGFDQLLRSTNAGVAFLAEVGKILESDVLARGGVLEYQRALAEASAYRSPFLSIVAGAAGAPSPVTLSISDPADLVAGSTASSTLPYGYAVSLVNQTESSPSILVTNLASTLYVVEARGTSNGPFDLGAIVPTGIGSVSQLRFANVPMQPGGLARLVIDLSAGSCVLQVDADGNGTFDETLTPSAISIVEQPLRVVAVKQVAELPGGILDPAGYGMALGVLFNKPVDETTADLAANYIAENNDVVAAKLQPSGRLAYVILNKGIGAHIPRHLTVQ